MSAEKHSDAHGEETHGEKPKKTSKGMIALWIIGGIALVLIVLMNIPSSSSTSSNGNTNSTGGNGMVTQIIPPLPPKSMAIGSTLSERMVLSDACDNYHFIFLCDQPYEIVNNDGTTFTAQAYEDVDIGILKANKFLRFRTTNGTNTTMNVHFTPQYKSNN